MIDGCLSRLIGDKLVFSFNFNFKLFVQVIEKLCKFAIFKKNRYLYVVMTQDFVILIILFNNVQN